jgi:hypothetical protein
MGLISSILWIVGVIAVMIFGCYLTSGISNIPGSIFEKKSTVEKSAKK